ncbi:MAG: DUF475 domain-containing protein [Cyanobacteria bacterium SIG30]|nr:DUF475 domain-containing protein [Cyanobacteria bacterium SIG30]
MFKYFKWSFIVTIVGLICAYLWGEHALAGSGFKTLFVALFLSILEVTLSFDNAIINAIRLEKMPEFWRKIFLTLGIIVAVFGVRLVLPIFIVAIFSNNPMSNVINMAFNDVGQYTVYLQAAHAPLVTFGGIFLGLIFFEYFLNAEKQTFWLTKIEKPLASIGNIHYSEVICAIILLLITINFVHEEEKLIVLISGLAGILTFLGINGVCETMERFNERKALTTAVAQMGFFNFLYLELIDASFSFDGLLGAFAISKDIIIIMIGLGIGAMFVRSLTIFMVNHKTLDKYLYLEHGAHWAIGFLSLIMFISLKTEVPEWVTGTFSLLIIVISLICSVVVKKKNINS